MVKKYDVSKLSRRDFLKTAGALGLIAAAGSSIPMGFFSSCSSSTPSGTKLPEIKFSYADTASNGTIAQFLQGQMKDNLGIDLTLDPMESAAFSAFVNQEGHQWAWFGWGADYPDPENFLNPNFVTGAGNNHTNYSNPQFDALAEAALKELDNTKRLKDWADAQAIMVADCPAVFMFYRERFILVKPRLQGLTPTGMDGGIMGDRFWTNVSMSSGAQELTVNLAGEPEDIDPNLASWATSLSVINQVFQGLLAFDKDLNVIKMGATEVPTVENGGISADGLTYTFHLNTQVTWSDNNQVITAGDYEYSLKRFLNPDNAAEYASLYYSIAGAEEYNGATDADAATKASLEAALGVKALDDTTLQVTLATPQPTFLQLMAMWPTYPLRKDIIDAAEAAGKSWTEAGTYIGNGPFLMTEWVHQDHITFAPNPNYFGTKPKLAKMTYAMITDAQAALAAYKNNELDMSGVPVGTEKDTMNDSTLSPQIVRNADLVTFGFEFNVDKAPLDNKLVRQAFSCAIDRAAFVDNVRGGVGKVALSWVPPGMPDYDPNLGAEWAFNVTKAKQLLDESGYTV